MSTAAATPIVRRVIGTRNRRIRFGAAVALTAPNGVADSSAGCVTASTRSNIGFESVADFDSLFDADSVACFDCAADLACAFCCRLLSAGAGADAAVGAGVAAGRAV